MHDCQVAAWELVRLTPAVCNILSSLEGSPFSNALLLSGLCHSWAAATTEPLKALLTPLPGSHSSAGPEQLAAWAAAARTAIQVLPTLARVHSRQHQQVAALGPALMAAAGPSSGAAAAAAALLKIVWSGA